MGLFSSKKNLCPLCGGPTPRLFSTKVEDMPLCKACADKIDLPSGALDRMSLQDLEQYMVCYDENEPRRAEFKETYHFGGGFLSEGLYFDAEHRLLRLHPADSNFAFTGDEIVSFRITEDSRPIFTGDAAGLVCHPSDIEDRLRALEPAIEEHRERMRDYQRMENMERLHDMVTDDDDRSRRRYYSRPCFNDCDPIKTFHIYVTLRHPYWKDAERTETTPRLDSTDPSIPSYLRDYDETAGKLRELADNLMALIAPGAPVREAFADAPAPVTVSKAAPAAAPAPSVDAVTEIKRYKDLLDAGIITEEEFSAKKRQLLGI